MTWEINELVSSVIRTPVEWGIGFGLFAMFCGVVLPYILVALFLFFEWRKHNLKYERHEIGWVLGPAFLAAGIAEIIKWIFPFPRPFIFDDSIIALASVHDTYGSFPSQHAMFFATLGTTLFLRNHKLGFWFLVGALIIGIARVALGVHWAFDVVEGLLLGVLVGQCSRLYEVGISRKIKV